MRTAYRHLRRTVTDSLTREATTGVSAGVGGRRSGLARRETVAYLNKGARPCSSTATCRVSQVRGRSGERFISPLVQRERIEGWAKLHGAHIGRVGRAMTAAIVPSKDALRRTTMALPLRATPEASIPKKTTPKSWTLTGVHVTTSESRGGRRYSLGKVLATVATVIGVVGGAAGLYTFLRSEFPDPRITAQHVGFEGEKIIQVGVVNSSPRAISIVGGEVRWKGYTVGQAQRRPRHVAGAWDSNDGAAGSKRLPFPIAGGESFAGAVVWDRGDSSSPAVLRGFAQTLAAPRSPERLVFGHRA